MSALPARRAVVVGILLLLHLAAAGAGQEAGIEKVSVRAYVDDSCIVADEPFFIPASNEREAADRAKFLPLIGLVIGKLTELYINHEVQASANRIKTGAARKDTRYAAVRNMNLYRAEFDPTPTLAINAKLGCMTIVAAEFQPDAVECTTDYVPKTLTAESVHLPQDAWKTSRTDDSIENQLRRANVCVVGKARAVYEARFEISRDGTAYRLKDAGYTIASLVTTADPRASRTIVYSLKISDPGTTEQADVLSSAWVNIGMVTAGARSTGGSSENAPWLRVPPLSAEARRNYEEKTHAHQEVVGEIDALNRALTRNQRVLAGIDERIAKAPPDIAAGLKQEHTRIAVQNEEQGAELDARRAEYRDLPRTPMEFMPVTIEVAVTETESEKKARMALADIIGKNSDSVASALGSEATGILSKSVDPADLKTEPEISSPERELKLAHDDYFDTLVDARIRTSGAERNEAQRRLVAAKVRYNTARRSLGMEPLP